MTVFSLIRAAFGLVYVLFIPGFVASWAVYPRRNDLTDLERIALSIGLSIVLSTMPLMLLNYLGLFVITEVYSFLAILSVTLVCFIVAAYRLSRSI
jgi:uncharacterized membrane protein